MSTGCKLLSHKCQLCNLPVLSKDQTLIPCPFSNSHVITLLLYSIALWTKHTGMRDINPVYKLLKLMAAKLKPLSGINNPTEKNLWNAQDLLSYVTFW